MSHTYGKILCHGVFSTAERRPFIRSEWREQLYRYLSGILTNQQGHLVRAGGTEDHVHVLVDLRPSLSASDAMRLLKTNSSKWIHETFPASRDFAWQTGYGVFSVSPSNEPDVIRYIDGQQEHHQRLSFQDEFRLLLQRHGIQFDEAHLWD